MGFLKGPFDKHIVLHLNEDSDVDYELQGLEFLVKCN